jgi:hypothetical protein
MISTSPKRPRPEEDEDVDETIVVHKKMKMEENKKSFKKFNIVADVMFGNFIKECDKLLTVTRPPIDNCDNLKNFLRKTLKGRYKVGELENVPNGKHKIIDVYNNLQLYNNVYYLTGKKEVTFNMSVSQAQQFSETKMTEKEFIKELFGESPSRFNEVYPMYNKNMITDIEFGAHAVMVTLEYFKTHDRKYILFGPSEKCKQLFEWLVSVGLANNLENVDHPPIPTSSRYHRYNSSIGAINNIFQIPESNFATISHVADNWDDFDPDFSLSDTGDKIYPVSELPDDERDYTLITTEYSLSGHVIGPKKVKYIHDIKIKKTVKNTPHTFIFVFRNSTNSKQCGHLDHCLIKGITRLQSYVKYLREHVLKNNKAVFKKYVIKYS